MTRPTQFAEDKPGWNQLCLGNFPISSPPTGDSSAALKEGCSVALAGYGRHCELHVNDKATITLGPPYV